MYPAAGPPGRGGRRREMSDAEVYDGARIRIRFEGSRCIHSRNCVLTLPTVFRPNVQGPWI
ncbi:MAG: (4Fe-4S)-binding protein, partial [Myxococcota bacterium]